MKNIPKVGNMSENIPTKEHTTRSLRLLEKQKTRFTCKFWSISMLLDPDPHFKDGSGSDSRTAKWIRIQGIRNQSIAFKDQKKLVVSFEEKI